MQQTRSGYSLNVSPVAFGTSGTHTWYSDQSMSIHQHNGKEPATANDLLLGETQRQCLNSPALSTWVLTIEARFQDFFRRLPDTPECR